jgi:LacI family transcriptional regulator
MNRFISSRRKMRITLKDVAREAETSVAAASATLSGKPSGNMRISEATRRRVIEVAARLGYVPNPIARSLTTGRTGVLGLVFPYVDAFVDRNPFCSMLMNGVFTEAIQDSYNMMLYTVRDGFWAGKHKIDPRVDGLVLALPASDEPLLLRCRESNFPCVAIVCAPQPDPIMTVNADDYQGGILATKHLLELGHKRIMMLHGGDLVSTNLPRLEGYRRAMQESGVQVTPDLIVRAGFDWRPGFEAMTAVLERPQAEWPTAIFAVNDLCAAGAIRAIKAKGLSIPEDFAIVGFDDTWFSTTTQPMLTSVRMPIKEMGALATRMLASEVNGKPIEERHPVLPVSLTIRNSCGASTQVPTLEFPES